MEYQRLALRMRCGSSLPEHTLLTATQSNSTVDNSYRSSEEEDPVDCSVNAATGVTTTNILNDPLPACPITLVSSPSDNNLLEVNIAVV